MNHVKTKKMLDEMRECLEFYADHSKYGHEDAECAPICKDSGRKAQEILKKFEEQILDELTALGEDMGEYND